MPAHLMGSSLSPQILIDNEEAYLILDLKIVFFFDSQSVQIVRAFLPLKFDRVLAFGPIL